MGMKSPQADKNVSHIKTAGSQIAAADLGGVSLRHGNNCLCNLTAHLGNEHRSCITKIDTIPSSTFMRNVHLSTSRECGPQKPGELNWRIELCYTSKEPTLANRKLHLANAIGSTYMHNNTQDSIETTSSTLTHFDGSR